MARRRVNNGRERKALRRKEAKERQEARVARTTAAQLKLIKQRPGESKKETGRLKNLAKSKE